ncbi:MAG: hypothetical protein ACOVOD_18380, partial [Rhodoferax sp.]
FILYGLLPLSIVMYIMGAPARRRARKAQEARQTQLAQAEGSDQPDAGGLPPTDPITPVREVP